LFSEFLLSIDRAIGVNVFPIVYAALEVVQYMHLQKELKMTSNKSAHQSPTCAMIKDSRVNGSVLDLLVEA
jgi:hypothetical protein